MCRREGDAFPCPSSSLRPLLGQIPRGGRARAPRPTAQVPLPPCQRLVRLSIHPSVHPPSPPGSLEVPEVRDQVVLVLQQEPLAGLEGGAEVGGEPGHVGGDVGQVPRRRLVVVGHLQGAGDGDLGSGTRCERGRAAAAHLARLLPLGPHAEAGAERLAPREAGAGRVGGQRHRAKRHHVGVPGEEGRR